MYLRTVHADHDLPTLYKFIREYPLGILTTSIPSPNHHTIQSSHIPWLLDLPSQLASSYTPPTIEDESPIILRGHLARANPQCKALIEASLAQGSNTLKDDILILFNHPVNHYITPKFYVETKPSTGKVVPTWNYAAVQVYGTITLFFDTSDPATDTFISKAIGDLSKQSEETIFGFDGKEGRPEAWNVGESPESYVSLLKKAIIGVEVRVKEIGGKFKASQELKQGDRRGVIMGFDGLETDEARGMAGLVRDREEVMRRGKDGV